MLALTLTRLAYALLVALAATSVVFLLLYTAGDPLAALVPPGSSPEQEAVLREHYGLDDSLARQYWLFISNAAQGDFGDSWVARRPAIDLVFERLPDTALLAFLSLGLSILVALPLGIFAAIKPGRGGDVLTGLVSGLGQSTPAFWLATVLVIIFAVHLQWLPSSGGEGWDSLVLPVLALAAYPTAVLSRLVRAAVLDAAHEDYVRTALSKGLTLQVVTLLHILPNALLPALAMCGVQAAYLIGGSAAVEAVFAYPGAGTLALRSVSNRDLPVVLAWVSVVAALIAFISMFVDLIAAWIDPRLRWQGEAMRGRAR